MGKKQKYYRYDVIYADLGESVHGVQNGIRPCVVVSCNAGNHDNAPQVTVVPLTSKIKNNPVHVVISPKEVNGFGIGTASDFLPEDIMTISKSAIRGKIGSIVENGNIRSLLDSALRAQLCL